jgi:hypothetical protein
MKLSGADSRKQADARSASAAMIWSKVAAVEQPAAVEAFEGFDNLKSVPAHLGGEAPTWSKLCHPATCFTP